MRLLIPICVLALLSLPTRARAELCAATEAECQSHEIGYADRGALFDAIRFDTGFVPSGSPFQLRAAFYLGAGTHVGMSGSLLAVHPPAVTLTASGHPEGGLLELDFGLEAHLQGRLAVLGFEETFDIPIPGVPRDLRFYAIDFFDPFLLGPLAVPAEVEDTIDRFTLLTVDLIDLIFPVPGFDGGLRIDVEGVLSARYWGDRLEVAGVGDLVEPAGSLLMPPHLPEGYGGSRELTVIKHGVLQHEGSLVLYPSLFITIFGVDAFESDIASIPIPIAEITTPVRFDPEEVTLRFADVDVQPRSVDFGSLFVGESAERPVRIFNDGEAELRWSFPESAGPFRASRLAGTLAPGSSGYVRVFYEPLEAGAAADALVLETNDPDSPALAINLLGEAQGLPDLDPADGGLEADAGEAGLDGGLDEGGTDGGGEALAGCGCDASRPAGVPLTEVILLGLALWLRRLRKPGAPYDDQRRRLGPSC